MDPFPSSYSENRLLTSFFSAKAICDFALSLRMCSLPLFWRQKGFLVLSCQQLGSVASILLAKEARCLHLTLRINSFGISPFLGKKKCGFHF
ncbi:hypothetical protein CEXT_685091 [Caerostris extrusa]|uniref:Uncharacterized protein n=1 Tax=Caerostris extrusa TaxID=172846 RepID=A0AAV4V1M3_CAEEX|nr:hypothetical protein CEXT_685091 [Caerostris extrusa]